MLTPFSPPPIEGEKGYRGVLALSYSGYRPTSTQALIGRLLAERAMAVVQRERLQAKNEHLLRRASQHSHRKLAALAAEVAETGVLDLPPGVGLLGQAPRPPRRSGSAGTA